MAGRKTEPASQRCRFTSPAAVFHLGCGRRAFSQPSAYDAFVVPDRTRTFAKLELGLLADRHQKTAALLKRLKIRGLGVRGCAKSSPAGASRLSSLDSSAAQAAGADARRHMSAAVVDPDCLKVRQPAPLGFVHRVADVITRHRALTAHVASFGHNGGSVSCAPSPGKARPGRKSSGMQPKSANREPV